MGDVVVIKFGGGLITNKSQMCTNIVAELETIDNLVDPFVLSNSVSILDLEL